MLPRTIYRLLLLYTIHIRVESFKFTYVNIADKKHLHPYTLLKHIRFTSCSCPSLTFFVPTYIFYNNFLKAFLFQCRAMAAIQVVYIYIQGAKLMCRDKWVKFYGTLVRNGNMCTMVCI